MPEQTFPLDLPTAMPAPAVEHALSSTVPNIVVTAWQDVAADHVGEGDYIDALRSQDALQYPYLGDVNAVAVVNTREYAQFLEYGRAGFHLPSRWGTGKGVWTTGKNGKRYARVPFAVTTPTKAGGGKTTVRIRTKMPRGIYDKANRLATGQRLGPMGPRKTRDYNEYRRTYTDAGSQAALNSAPLEGVDSYTWKSKQFSGLFNAGEKTTPGGGTQTMYMTIRTITPESEGWFIPPTPAYLFATRALADATPIIRDALDEAAAQDIAVAVVAALGREQP